MRLPPEVGELSALREFVPYTSHRLHWFPYELTRCGFTRTTVSTRVLYGNHKSKPMFPRLGPSERAGASALQRVLRAPGGHGRASRSLCQAPACFLTSTQPIKLALINWPEVEVHPGWGTA